MPAVAVRCPHCGATLEVRPADSTTTCAYCGTTSMLGPQGARVRPPEPARPGPSAAWVLGGAMMLVVAIGAAALVMRGSPEPPPGAPPAVVRPLVTPALPQPGPELPPVSEPPRRVVERIETDRRPLLADVDGDGQDDVIALMRLREGDRRWEAHAALSGASGALLWDIPAEEERTSSRIAAVAHGRLLVLTHAGQVLGHDLKTGAAQWSTALGDRGLGFCAAKEADAALIVTADERVLKLDVKTGRQEPVQAPKSCAPLPSDHTERRSDPRDRSDPRGPAGVTAIRCGSVRVMGSQNYTVADQCRARAKIDPDRLDGAVAHALWQVPEGWFFYGVREPGTNSPVVGRISGKRVAWKADVPEGNPLEAREVGPDPVLLVGDAVIVGYETQKHERYLTAFALADGQRRWHVASPGEEDVSHAATSGGLVFLYVDHAVVVLDPKDGSVVRTFGPS